MPSDSDATLRSRLHERCVVLLESASRRNSQPGVSSVALRKGNGNASEGLTASLLVRRTPALPPEFCGRLPDPDDAEDFRVFADPAGHPFCLVFDT